jgi:hypothetical protein
MDIIFKYGYKNRLDYLKYILDTLRLFDKVSIVVTVQMRPQKQYDEASKPLYKSTQYYTFCKHFYSVYFLGVLIIFTSTVPALLTSSA